MHARLWLLPVVVLGIAAALWQAQPQTEQAPACAFRLGSGTAIRHAENFAKLAPETPFTLSLHLRAPHHVYVLSHSTVDGTLLLFPSPQLQSDQHNPLPAQQSVLPGRIDGKELAWTTRSGIEPTTTVLVLASREPIPELDTLLPKLRRWSNSVFPDRSMQVTLPAAGSEPLGKPREDWPAPLLRNAAQQVAQRVDPNGPLEPLSGQPGVFVTSWRCVETR
jgi:hypothetical protein